jgi:hypothetical protein
VVLLGLEVRLEMISFVTTVAILVITVAIMEVPQLFTDLAIKVGHMIGSMALKGVVVVLSKGGEVVVVAASRLLFWMSSVKSVRNMVTLQISVGGATRIARMVMMMIITLSAKGHMASIQTGTWILVLLIILQDS